MNIYIYILFYFILINLISFSAMYIDKRKAVTHKWRISEFNLIMLSVIGGSVGMLLGMHIFRHKTKHKKFTIGVPIILAAQIIIFVLLR